MKSADRIQRLFHRATVTTRGASDDAVFQKLKTAYVETRETGSAPQRPTIWRFVMRSPKVKLTMAAAVVLMGALAISLWQGMGSGIALADVLTRMEQVTAYMYQMHVTRTGQNINGESTGTVLVSREHGIKVAYRKADPNKGDIAVGDTYLLPRQTSIVFVDHKEKTYTLIKEDRGKISYYREEYNEPHTIIKQFLACDHISLGQSVIDGVTVEGFQTTDLNYKGGFFGQDDYFIGDYTRVDVKLWVNTETFLPVRLEEDVVTSHETHIHQICYDFRWNVILSAADFEPNIPDDYTAPFGDVIIPVFSEENAVKGLRLIGDLLGKYPKSLGQTDETFKGEIQRAAGWDDSYDVGLSNDEKTKITSKVMLMIVPQYFYDGLVENKKDPAYYGETVGPDDTDKVLLRWKLEDGRHRVIFGDLHAETVSPEGLAELEKTLPK
jgi:outer membrane lipoprotein-sorting protein